MSDSPENSAIMRAIVEGARDFLLKPLRVEELKVLWQHVVRYTSEITKLDGTDPAKVAGPGPSKVAGDTAQSKEEVGRSVVVSPCGYPPVVSAIKC